MMSELKVRQAAHWCRQRIKSHGACGFPVEPQRNDAKESASAHELVTPERVRHLLFMCDEIEALMAIGSASRREKAMRWLGFVQGSIHMAGWASIDEMKDANRPDDGS